MTRREMLRHQAAEAWVDRAIDIGHRTEVRRLLNRAEELAVEVNAPVGASNLLPGALTHRLRGFAQAVRAAVPVGTQVRADAIAAAERELLEVERHRFVEPVRA